MKHGRPTADDYMFDEFSDAELSEGWRREHAHRVWNAMQAVVCLAVVDTLHELQGQALNYGSDQMRREAYENMRRCARTAGWVR